MNIWLLARKEIGDLYRDGRLRYVVLLLMLFVGGSGYAIGREIAGDASPAVVTGVLVETTLPIALLLVPGIGIVFGYEAITKPRAEGQLTLLLAQPHSRFGVVAGILLGRWLAIAVAILAGFLVAVGVLLATGGGVELGMTASYVGFVIGLGWLYLSIGICLSALTKSTTFAAVGAFATLLISLLWFYIDPAIGRVSPALHDALGPDMLAYLIYLSPVYAWFSVLETVLLGSLESGSPFGQFLPSVPLGYTAAVLASWFVVSFGVAVVAFGRAEL